MKNRQVSQRIFLGSQETKQINGRGRRSRAPKSCKGFPEDSRLEIESRDLLPR